MEREVMRIVAFAQTAGFRAVVSNVLAKSCSDIGERSRKMGGVDVEME